MQEWTYPVPKGWSSWDKINIKGDSSTTLEKFIEMVKEQHHNVEVTNVMKYGITQQEIDEGKGKSLWSNAVFPAKLKEQNEKYAKMSVIARYKEIYGPVSETYIILDVEATKEFEAKDKDPKDKEDGTEREVEIPKILFSFQ